MRNRQIAPVHSVGQDGLRMRSVEKVDADSPLIVRMKDDERVIWVREGNCFSSFSENRRGAATRPSTDRRQSVNPP
jgi:hypothetical protein